MRKFLYTIVVGIFLVAAVLFALRLYGEELTQAALVPDAEFAPQDALATNAYQDPAMWFSRPGIGAINDPARWQPSAMELTQAGPVRTGEAQAEETPSPQPTPDIEQPAEEATQAPDFAVFFVHPTSFLDGSKWNAPLDDQQSQDRARLMVRGMASAFNQASEIWVPRYRQATFGAFLTDLPEAQQAIDAAYADIEQAFDFFVNSVPADRPIVLAGHSQGALHVMRLLEQRVTRSDLASRVVMAYPIGWPISLEHDLPSLGMPACAAADQAGCIVGWASFAEPADPGMFLSRYETTAGLDGQIRGESPILCVNPISGVLNDTASMNRNLGTLVPEDDLTGGELIAGAVPARCNAAGLLLVGNPPQLGPYVFPGNNYHVYDIPLFWKNLQEDVTRRIGVWTSAQGTVPRG